MIFKGSGGTKRQRLSVINYKECILTQLLEAKTNKESELGRSDPLSLKRVRERECVCMSVLCFERQSDTCLLFVALQQAAARGPQLNNDQCKYTVP